MTVPKRDFCLGSSGTGLGAKPSSSAPASAAGPSALGTCRKRGADSQARGVDSGPRGADSQARG
eukprot:589058-Prorocentrum_minimum.AAC.1